MRVRGGWSGETVRGKREEEEDLPTVYAMERSAAHDGTFQRKLENAIQSTDEKGDDDIVVKTEPDELITAEGEFSDGDFSDDEGVKFLGVSCAPGAITLTDVDVAPIEKPIEIPLNAPSDDGNRGPDITGKLYNDVHAK